MIREIARNKQALTGLVMIALVSLVAATAPLIVSNDPHKMDIANRFVSSNAQYPLGTDQLGRCVLSRLLLGASYSLGIAVPTLMVLGGLGLILGTAAAYIGRRLEQVFLIICDIFMAFPSLVIVLSLIGALGQGILGIVVAVMFSLWAWYAKVVWSYASLEKSKEYILSCIIAGCRHRRIIFRHVIPNILPQFVLYLSTGMASMSQVLIFV